MTPLTHAAVGMALFEKLRRVPPRPLGWVLAFLLAFASHYALDAIPHFEDIGPLVDSPGRVPIFIGLGIAGVLMALLLRRWNRPAAGIWLVFSLWIALGSNSYVLWRIPTAVLALGWLAYRSRRAEALGFLLAGMLAVAADFVPLQYAPARSVHYAAHYKADLGLRLHRAFSQEPVPARLLDRLQSPYFLAGYGLELLAEAVIFFGSLYLFFFRGFYWKKKKVPEKQSQEPEESDRRKPMTVSLKDSGSSS